MSNFKKIIKILKDEKIQNYELILIRSAINIRIVSSVLWYFFNKKTLYEKIKLVIPENYKIKIHRISLKAMCQK